jgi:hypothetical protein
MDNACGCTGGLDTSQNLAFEMGVLLWENAGYRVIVLPYKCGMPGTRIFWTMWETLVF